MDIKALENKESAQSNLARTQPQSKLVNLQQSSLILLVFSVIAYLFSKTIADPDLWGHLRFGLDMLNSKTIPRTDPYSYLTAGQTWINHEWLAEVSFALAWKVIGSTGLILLKMSILILMLALVYKYLASLNLPAIRAGFLLVLASISLFPFAYLVRPQIYTYLLFTCIVLIILQAESGRYGWLWVGPPIFILWANLHGGFLAGLSILGVWTFLHFVADPGSWKKIFPPAICSVIAVVVNPYGIDLMLFLLRTAIVPRPEISDWQPLKIFSTFGFVYLLLVCVFSLGWIYTRKARKFPLFFLFVLLSLLPLTALRHLPLFGLGGMLLASEHLIDIWNQIYPGQKRYISLSTHLIWIQLAVCAVLVGLGLSNLAVIQIPEEVHFPRSIVSLLKNSGVSCNLITEFDWGEYLIWHLGPGIKVSIDGRRETVYSQDVYAMNLNFMTGRGDWDALLNIGDPELALIGTSSSSYNLLRLLPEWELIYQYQDSSLFIRTDSTLLKTLISSRETIIYFDRNDQFP